MTTTRTKRTARTFEETRAEVDDWEPLPTAEELAGPIVEGILILQELFDSRARTIALGYESGEFRVEAEAMMDLSDQVARILRGVASSCTCHIDGGASTAAAVDHLIRMLTELSELESIQHSGQL